MASITKLKTGWRAQVARKGVRKSQMFPTKAAAQAWALAEERPFWRRRADGIPEQDAG